VPRLGARRLLPSERRQSARYSRFVGWAKLILPTAAGGLIAALGAWPYVSANFERLAAQFPRLDVAQVRDQRMLNPRYSGIDKQQRPFTITAESGRQEGGDASDGLIALDTPKADIQTKEGAWVVVTGNTGIYQPQAHFLDLAGDVTLFHDKGYEFKTATARVYVEDGMAEGHDAIAGAGPSGSISGEGFRMLHNGDTVMFTGKSTLVMNGAHGEAK
jgi:lipopolysaccharide export system protein LptC